jgi:hypothetical protein
MIKQSIVFLGLVLAGCAADGPTPRAACEQVVSGLCARLYTCFSSDEFAGAGLPSTQAACITQGEANEGCAARTATNSCSGGTERYHASEVASCLDQIDSLNCGEVRQTGISVGAPACDKICAIDN